MSASKDYWLPVLPAQWQRVPAWILFTEGTERAHAADVHLTPSRKYGVIPQAKYAELSGHRPISNDATAGNMKKVYPNDFVISMGSFESGIEHSTIPGKVSNDYRVLRPTGYVEPKYFRWFLKSSPLIDALDGLTGEIRVGQRIHYSQFSRLSLPLPDLPTQRRIADYLDRETAQIDAMAGALDGLVARLEERRDALRDGVLRRVPITVQLQFVTQGIHTGPFGTQLGRGDYVNDGIPVINPTHIVNASILPDAKVSVSASSADRLQAHRMRAGEIVMARRGDLGRCAVVDEKSSGFICGTGSILISPDATKVDSRFAQVSLSSTDTVFQLEDASVGSTMSNLSESTLRHIRIPFPSLDEQRRIVAHLDAETAKIDAMIAKAGELRALLDERRSALITATVTGQHPVPEEP